MININNLDIPDFLEILDYEKILSDNIENFKKLLPNYDPLESDDFKILLESFSYRELHLRASFNNRIRAFFLSTATGSALDYYSVFYGIDRLKGSKPYAKYNFKLSNTINQDIVIPANLVLTDENSKFTAILLNDVIIKNGERSSSGLVEFQIETTKSDIKTEVITTTLPFVITANSLEEYSYGSNPESDTDFRNRILLSMADKSTAGSELTYKSFAFKADERIKDIAVLNGGPGIVNVFFFSPLSDALMKTRIENKLNQKEVRPLTDHVIVTPAEVVKFSIKAELKILPSQETASIYTAASESLTKGLKTLNQIGTDITLSEINDFLKVPGVKEVIINEPLKNILIKENEIGINNANAITYSII